MENQIANPLVSIILPIFNVESYLPKCMDTLLSQTYQNIELLLVDDGSAISCSKLCDNYSRVDSRIRVFHKENGGLSDARNFGMNYAEGDYIIFVDPDDYVDADYVEYLINLIKKYDCKMSICQYRRKRGNGVIENPRYVKEKVLSTTESLENLLYRKGIEQSAYAKCYHKSLFKNIKYPKGKIYEDIGTTYALILQCDRIAVGSECKYTYIFHENSIMNEIFNKRQFDMIEMADQMALNILKIYPDLCVPVQSYQALARLSVLNRMIKVDGYEDERREIVHYIITRRKDILFNSNIDTKHKIAVITLSINYNFYKKCWLTYLKFKKEFNS